MSDDGSVTDVLIASNAAATKIKNVCLIKVEDLKIRIREQKIKLCEEIERNDC